MNALAHLAALDRAAYRFAAKRASRPTVPLHALPKSKFSDATANELTRRSASRAVIRCIQLQGGYARSGVPVRVNTQGQYSEKLGKWTTGTTRRGTADVHAVAFGLHLSIEVKIGRDRLSDEQRATAEDVERAGGRYFVARDFASFYAWFSALSQTEGGERA